MLYQTRVLQTRPTIRAGVSKEGVLRRSSHCLDSLDSSTPIFCGINVMRSISVGWRSRALMSHPKRKGLRWGGPPQRPPSEDVLLSVASDGSADRIRRKRVAAPQRYQLFCPP